MTMAGGRRLRGPRLPQPRPSRGGGAVDIPRHGVPDHVLRAGHHAVRWGPPQRWEPSLRVLRSLAFPTSGTDPPPRKGGPRSDPPRSQALDELSDLLEGLQPLRGLADLRRLSEVAEELLAVVDAAAGLAWAPEGELDDVQDELVQLEDHRQELQALADLDGLADESAPLTPLLRRLRRRVDDLQCLSEEHASEEVSASWRAPRC